jgi:predicted metal-dependent phosphoesterase TrpH
MRFAASIVLLCVVAISSQAEDVRREVRFPDVPGYHTLACDFHMHTVFSDGLVWPTVRVREAWRQGLDAIAITDHVEYRPHKDDISTGHNRPYDLARSGALAENVLLARAVEITRETPPGHFNAIFIDDADLIETPDFVEAIKRANEQGGFVFWNHHEWKGAERGRWLDVHSTLYDNGWLHGMEIANGSSYYPTAHAWCLEKNLTMIGSSDIHAPDLRRENTAAEHRTLTLVFAKERTLDALQQALRKGRTVVWFDDQLIGRASLLTSLFHCCVQVSAPHFRAKNYVMAEIHNLCAADIHLQRRGDVGPSQLTLPALSTSLVRISTDRPDEALQLDYEATNLLVRPASGLPVTLEFAAAGAE